MIQTKEYLIEPQAAFSVGDLDSMHTDSKISENRSGCHAISVVDPTKCIGRDGFGISHIDRTTVVNLQPKRIIDIIRNNNSGPDFVFSFFRN